MNNRFEYDFCRMTGHKYNFRNQLKYLVINHGLRFVYLCRKRERAKLSLIKYCYFIRLKILGRKYGLEMLTDNIGKGLYLGHAYNITVNYNAVIGENVSLHKCTIGAENRGVRKGCPVIGNNVYIGINSTVVGNVKIGDNVLIAPGAYVNFDVPNYSIVIGNPGKIIANKDATLGYL